METVLCCKLERSMSVKTSVITSSVNFVKTTLKFEEQSEYQSKAVCCVWLHVSPNYNRSLVLSCGNIVSVLFIWNRIKILLRRVNEVSHFVLCACEYLERDGWLGVMSEHSSGVREIPPPPPAESISSALSLCVCVCVCVYVQLHEWLAQENDGKLILSLKLYGRKKYLKILFSLHENTSYFRYKYKL
jgi:hypothetical protein